MEAGTSQDNHYRKQIYCQCGNKEEVLRLQNAQSGTRAPRREDSGSACAVSELHRKLMCEDHKQVKRCYGARDAATIGVERKTPWGMPE